ncbi:MFS transporter [Mucilaginibacter sp. R11]|uniref:MFS transporter n=2 Tax=Mucilaginibacter agri TaxID=2695265 RepID=A0A965ZHE9_9SPHI|nr:MFS transporter [Mucilaginibacter agri]
MIQEPQVVYQGSNTATYRTVLFALCFLSSALGGTVSTLMSVYLPVVVKELQGDQSAEQMNTISGYINALFIFGWALGGFSWGMICDNLGRKKSLLLSIGCYGLFTMLTGFMQNWYGIVLCRFMSGFGVGGVLVVSFTLISEIWPTKSKAIYTGILSIAFPVGIFSAGVINNIVSSWREGFYVGIIPVLIALVGIWAIQESDQWVNHRINKALAPDKSKALFSPVNRKQLFISSITFGTMLVGLWAIFSWLPTWVQSISTGDAQKERGLSMMFLGMGGLSGGFISGWFVNMAGLRRSMIICFSVCSVFSFLLFKTNTVFTPMIYAEIAMLALFFGISQGVLSVYVPQLFPTAVRASATGFSFNIGRIFTGLAVLFVGVLVNYLGGYSNAIFIFSLVFIIGLIVVIFVTDYKITNHNQ